MFLSHKDKFSLVLLYGSYTSYCKVLSEDILVIFSYLIIINDEFLLRY